MNIPKDRKIFCLNCNSDTFRIKNKCLVDGLGYRYEKRIYCSKCGKRYLGNLN